MKKLVLFAVLVSVLLGGCGGGEEDKWQSLESKEGKFSVLFPGEPEEQSNSVSTAIGTLELKSFTTDKGDRAFLVSFVDYPADILAVDVKTRLDDGVTGAVSNINGKLLEEKDITLAGHSGREFRAEAKVGNIDAIFHFRAYVFDTRMYIVQVVSPKDDASSPDVAKFLDSFQLLQ